MRGAGEGEGIAHRLVMADAPQFLDEKSVECATCSSRPPRRASLRMSRQTKQRLISMSMVRA